MNTLLSRAILPGILNELLSSGVNCRVNRQLNGSGWPRVDIVENDDSYSLKVELPGMTREEISIIVEKGILQIEGEKKEEVNKENTRFYHFEREYGKFSRPFALPEGVDPSKIEAKMANGVLEITIAKAEKAKPTTIEIK